MSETMARPRPLPAALAVELDAARQGGFPIRIRNAWAIIGDGDDHLAGRCGCIDTDRRFCVACGVFDEIAEDFGQVAFIDRRRQICRDIDLE